MENYYLGIDNIWILDIDNICTDRSFVNLLKHSKKSSSTLSVSEKSWNPLFSFLSGPEGEDGNSRPLVMIFKEEAVSLLLLSTSTTHKNRAKGYLFSPA